MTGFEVFDGKMNSLHRCGMASCFEILEVLTYLQSQILPMFNSTHHHNIKCPFKSSIQFCIKESQTELCNKFDFSFQFLSCLNSHLKKLFRPQSTFIMKFTLLEDSDGEDSNEVVCLRGTLTFY